MTNLDTNNNRWSSDKQKQTSFASSDAHQMELQLSGICAVIAFGTALQAPWGSHCLACRRPAGPAVGDVCCRLHAPWRFSCQGYGLSFEFETAGRAAGGATVGVAGRGARGEAEVGRVGGARGQGGGAGRGRNIKTPT